MKPTPWIDKQIGDSEIARLGTLADYELDVSEREHEFDHIVRLAARLFDIPVSVISIVAEDQQFFKARVGTDLTHTPRDISFCNHVIEARKPMVVRDTLEDKRFVDNPLVVASPHLRFYAGAPLIVDDGHPLGTLCLLDNSPRQFSDDDLNLLTDLAKLVVDRMELRRSARKLKAKQAELDRLAHYDPLTGLSNRAHFLARADRMLKKHVHDKDKQCGVILVDIDSFRRANGLLGERIGDEILKTITERMLTTSQGGIYARIGDDEFGIFQHNITDTEFLRARTFAFREMLQSGFDVSGQVVNLDVSMGYALSPDSGTDIDTLMANAQLALRAAKKEGTGVQQFLPEYRARVEEKDELNADIRRGIENDEFELFYQPQIDLLTDKIVGAEALLRWRHPEHGIMAPGYFLSAMEAMPLSLSVGDKCLVSAISQASAWQNQGTPVRVSVNLFASQFMSNQMLQTISSQLAEHGLRAHLLEIELTETVAIDSGRRVIESLEKLHEIGVGIALDDFGTGYASLTAIKKIPANRLKIDRQFVVGAANSKQDAAVVEAMICIGERLGLAITAEGIETEAEENWVRSAGCREVQGYRYGKPMPADELTALLKNEPRVKIAL